MADDEQEIDLKKLKRRVRNPPEWKREKQKRLRVAGQEYVNTKGDVVKARKLGSDCNCRRKCFENITDANRKILFDGYYALNSHHEQNAYLYGLIRKHDIARKRNKASDRRTCTYKYYVRIKGKEVQVCRLAFSNIHGISPHKIRILCQKMDQNIMFPRDERGKHNNRPKKIPPEMMVMIKTHIYSIIKSDKVKDFIKEERNNGPDVNITKMWKDFLQQYDTNFHLYNITSKNKHEVIKKPDTESSTSQPTQPIEPLVKHWLYSKVFHEEFKFHDFLSLKKKLWDLRMGIKVASALNKAERKQKSPKKISRGAKESVPPCTVTSANVLPVHVAVQPTFTTHVTSATSTMTNSANQNDVYLFPLNMADLNLTPMNCSNITLNFPPPSMDGPHCTNVSLAHNVNDNSDPLYTISPNFYHSE